MSKPDGRRARRSRGDDAPSTGHRHERLQQILHEELDALLQDEVTDPALDDARIVSVILSPDYGLARVCVAVPASRDLIAVERAIVRVSPFLRARVGDALDLKRTPDVRLVAVIDDEAGSNADSPRIAFDEDEE